MAKSRPKQDSSSSKLKFLDKAHLAVRSHLAATTDLPTFLQMAGTLTLNQRQQIVEQALILFQENYVHLPYKESMHGVDPVQRLRLLKHRLELSTPATMGSELAFHTEMLEVFHSVRDLHTNYLLPAPFSNAVAFLPFAIELYYENGQRHYIATHFMRGFSHTHFKSGAHIMMWNGVPIERAVEIIANRHAGSNQAARHVRGLDGLTIRPLRTSLPPDEWWVVIGYVDLDGVEREMQQTWLVGPDLPVMDEVDAKELTVNAATLGVDLEVDITRRTKKMLFAPQVIAAEKDATPLPLPDKLEIGQTIPSTMSSVFNARSVQTPSGVFAHVRIYTFNVKSHHDFLDEFIRLLDLLPQNGLILDVRGNGGGLIWASECLLQLLTPLKIEPEGFQFINTPLNLRICRRHAHNPAGIDLGPWVESIRESVETGAIYSRSFPITSPDEANRRGQHYHGPVVLITDARCYSATDILAAGFQDHRIGRILGVDDNTGAGGANVWMHGLLRQLLQHPAPADSQSPYTALSNGADMRVSIRRSLRVGAQAGATVEDLGVRPDERHFLTQNDLLNSNEDLINRAGEILATMPVRLLKVATNRLGTMLKVDAEILGLSRLDVFINGRPLRTIDLADGTHSFEIPLPPIFRSLELAGYLDDVCVAARKLSF